jgi:plasmid maintenance system antidote protein VapI
MQREKLENFIKHCGSVEKAAKIIQIKREQLSAIRNGRNQMEVGSALLIAEYLDKCMDIKVNFLDLLSPYKKNRLKRVRFNLNDSLLTLSKMFLHDVKHHTKTDWISEELSDLDKARPIIVDEKNRLIGNHITYFLHIQNKKTTLPAWKVSLSYLISIFDLIELGYIGISLENLIGNRQGRRTDLFKNKNQSEYELRLKLDEVTGRTDQFIANLLGLTRTQYRQLKKIILHESDELIEQVRNKEMPLFRAASIASEYTRLSNSL